MKKLCLILLLIIANSVTGSNKTDSITSLINSTKIDTIKVICYEQLGANYRLSNEDSALFFNQKALDVADKIEDKRFLAEAFREYGLTAQAIGKYDLAAEYYEKSLDVHELLNNSGEVANCMNDIGIAYYYAGNYDNAREYFEKSGVKRMEVGDSIGAGQAFNNTGIMYDIAGKPKKAISLYLRALSIYESAMDTNLMIGTYANIGIIQIGQKNFTEALKTYEKQKELSKAINHEQHYAVALISLATVYDNLEKYIIAREGLEEALEIVLKLNNKPLVATCYTNLAANYELTNESKKALEFSLKAIKIKEEIGANGKMAISQISAAKAYDGLKQYNKSISLYKQALDNAIITNYFDYIVQSHKGLSIVYGKTGNYKQAYHHQSKFIAFNDSILSQENSKIIKELEEKYENEKKQGEIELLNRNSELKDVKLAKSDEESKRKSIQLYAALLGVLLLVILAGLILKNNQERKKNNNILLQKNDEISEQKDIVDEKNKEILDSITYAKRIQNAILPTPKIVKEYLQESFILYKPKDIVAGDFYWMESVVSNNKQKVLFAAADCTGHGVPGAMVSVVCHNALNRSVREYGLTDPGEILDKTREIVIQEFEKSDEDVKDGMDIALCSLQENTLKYAGAHNPLWLVKKNEIIEIKANKQPIGKFDNPVPYTTHTINLEKEDSLYIFSDGFVDQFG
ncbi:tetratricopeptide repeat protein, partial [Vicingaceae bacterium]|nr:tetratricopeptide repeat protein [Vicingaceae bacterium]